MKCPTCGKDVDNLDTHNNQFHDALEVYGTEEDQWTCDVCGKELPYGSQVGDHLLKEHNITAESKATEEVCPSCNGSGIEDPETPNKLGLSASQPCKTCGGSGEKAGEARRKATERSKKEIQKEIKKLQEFINVASFENPFNVGADQEKLSELQVEYQNATEAEDRPVVQGDPVSVASRQCFDWEGHEIDCDSGEIIGDGYSKSEKYQRFLNEAEGDEEEWDQASIPERKEILDKEDSFVPQDKLDEPYDELHPDAKAELAEAIEPEEWNQADVPERKELLDKHDDFVPQEDLDEPYDELHPKTTASFDEPAEEVEPEEWDKSTPEEKENILDEEDVFQHDFEEKEYDELHPDVKEELVGEADGWVIPKKERRTDVQTIDDDEYTTGYREDLYGEEIEHQQDKPEISQKDWDEDLAGLKDEYATEDDADDEEEYLKDLMEEDEEEVKATEDDAGGEVPDEDEYNDPQFGSTRPKQTSAEEDTSDYEVDVDEYLKTGEPVQKTPEDKRAEEDAPLEPREGDDFQQDMEDPSIHYDEDGNVVDPDQEVSYEAEEDENVCAGCGHLEDYLNDDDLCEECELEASIDRKESERDAYEAKASEISRPITDKESMLMFDKPWDELTQDEKLEMHRILADEAETDDDVEWDEKTQNWKGKTEAGKTYLRETETDIETSDDGTDRNTVMFPDIDQVDTDDTGINVNNRYGYDDPDAPEFNTESWDRRITFNTKVEAFESLGLSQGDSLKLAELNWRDLSIEVRGALNEVTEDEKKQKRKDTQDAFNDEGAGDGADQPDTKIKNLDEIDYNIIGDNPLGVEKYECEHCNSGFKSNEALMIHFNDLHAPAREFLLDVPNVCTLCDREIPSDISMDEHMAYDHGISLDAKVENGMVADGNENEENDFKKWQEWSNMSDVEKQQHSDKLIEDVKSEENGQVEDGFEKHRGEDFGGKDWGRALTMKKLNDMEESEEGGQGSGPHASLPEQAGRDPSLQYDPFAPDPDPVGDPRSAKLTEGKIKGNESLKKKNISNESSPQEWWDNFLTSSDKELLHRELNLSMAYPAYWDDLYLEDQEKVKQSKTREDEKGYTEESWKPHVYKATEAVSYEEFKEDEHPREDSGKFTSGGAGTKQKEKPKPTKNLNKAKDKILKNMGEPKDDYDRNKYNMVKNLDGYPQHSSQLRSVGVRHKVPIMKSHLQDTYPESKWSVRTEYYSGGSSIRAAWTGGGPYPYGADSIRQLYSDSGATDIQVDYFDVDNYVDLYDNRKDKPEFDHGQHIYKDREERFSDWARIHLDQKGEYEASNTWSKKIAEDFTKNDVTGYQGISDDVLKGLKELYGKFQDQEKKEGGGATPKEVPKSTSPASYMKPTTQQRADEPHEFPIDPETGEDLPVSAYNPNAPQYRKPDPEDTKKDVTRAYGLMKGQKGKQDEQPWQKGGESRANEDYIPEPYKKHFDWVASMDQDDYVCKHCGEMMMNRDGTNALHTAPVSEIIEVVKQHLSTHGITESYATEDFEIDLDKVKSEIGVWKIQEQVDGNWNDVEYGGISAKYIGKDGADTDARTHEAGTGNPTRIIQTEAMYGYGSATGRMSPRDAWEQGASSEGGLNPVFREFRTLHWSELPADIQELWKSELEYLTVGEAKANEDFQPERQGKKVKLLTGDYEGKTGTISSVSIFGDDFYVRVDGVHNEYEQGVPISPSEVEFLGGEARATESAQSWWNSNTIDERADVIEKAGVSYEDNLSSDWYDLDEDVQNAIYEIYSRGGESLANERDIGWDNKRIMDQAWDIMAEQEFGKKVEDLTDAQYQWIEDLMEDYGNTMNPADKPSNEANSKHTGAHTKVYDAIKDKKDVETPWALANWIVHDKGMEKKATEEEVPWDMSEGDRARLELRSQDFVTEDDPDFETDPDYQGFVGGKKKESSQYTQQGIAKAMADPDYDILDEVKANEYMSHDDVLIEGVMQWHEQGGNVEADAQQIADQLNQEYGADFEDHPSGKFTADHVRNVYNAIKHTRLGE